MQYLGEDTIIYTDKGKTPVRDLEGKTPILYSYDRKDEKFIIQGSKGIWFQGIEIVYEIVFEYGITLETTFEYKILTMGQLYTKLSNLKLNDKIKSIYKWLDEDRIIDINKIGEKRVYGIDTGTNIGNFIANGFVVHP